MRTLRYWHRLMRLHGWPRPPGLRVNICGNPATREISVVLHADGIRPHSKLIRPSDPWAGVVPALDGLATAATLAWWRARGGAYVIPMNPNDRGA